jgi:hypothetical protein
MTSIHLALMPKKNNKDLAVTQIIEILGPDGVSKSI